MSAPLEQVMAGCTVLLTADRRRAELAEALQRRGARTQHAPAAAIISHADDVELRESTRELIHDPPEVLVVTTGVGFRAWIEAADAAGLAAELLSVLGGTRILARGAKAHGAILAAGLRTDWVARSETAAEVAEHLLSSGVAGRRVAVQEHASGTDGLTETLTAAEAQVQTLVVYRWGPPADPVALTAGLRDCAAGAVDAVVFTSAPAAAAWLAAADSHGVTAQVLRRFGDGSTVPAVIGPVTAGPLLDRGLRPLQPERSRLGALVRALTDHYTQLRSRALPTPAGALELRAREVVLGGVVVALPPGGQAVLRLLAAARGRVVPRERLLRVLPGDSTDPHAVEMAVARVREAVGRELIKTVVKRGYRVEVAPEPVRAVD